MVVFFESVTISGQVVNSVYTYVPVGLFIYPFSHLKLSRV
jgi:hypothetical protein